MQFRNRHFFVADLVLITFSVLFSFALRLELGPLSLFLYYLPLALWMVGLALIIKPLVYYRFGLYRRLWAYASIRELKLIVGANTVASILLALALASLWLIGVFSGPIYTGFPRSVIAIDWLLSMFAIGGLRFMMRVILENRSDAASDKTRDRRVLIVGAGDAGALVVREMQKSPRLNLIPVCFLDDDTSKQNQEIYGIPVVGTLQDIALAVAEYEIGEVIIATPSAPGKVVRTVADACRRQGVPFRTMPGIYELIGGNVTVSRLREVDIDDLLRRPPTQIDEELVGSSIAGKRVMITGGGGSIGSELCRQAARWKPAELVILGHGENSIFEILLELGDDFPELRTIPIVADVRDRSRLEMVFERYKPEVIFHAAAHKHVVLMEKNVTEAVTNNILGTQNLVDSAVAHGVDRLVMISTDKAIKPSSVMGATKRISEILVLSAAKEHQRSFSVVRFGNVLGSRGSVIPRFKQQIARGGPITVTHPDMERYFMTIPEAVHLVLQAAAMGQGGEVFLLNMGEPIRIVDLAEDLIRLSGLEPGRDIEIVFTGIQPGEKLSESLWEQGSGTRPTTHPDILRLMREEDMVAENINGSVDELIRLAREGDKAAVIRLLDRLIPGSQVEATSLSIPDATR
jgi:FlaA1/EpsC-like NDP-sugar epimerase